MTLALQMFHRLCEVANEFDRMREGFPVDAQPALVLAAVVESLDTWIDFLVRSNGLCEVEDPYPPEEALDGRAC